MTGSNLYAFACANDPDGEGQSVATEQEQKEFREWLDECETILCSC